MVNSFIAAAYLVMRPILRLLFIAVVCMAGAAVAAQADAPTGSEPKADNPNPIRRLWEAVGDVLGGPAKNESQPAPATSADPKPHVDKGSETKGSAVPANDASGGAAGALFRIFESVSGAIEGFFDPREKKLKALVDAGSHAEAAAFYVEHEARFAKSETARALGRKIVSSLKAAFASRADAALAVLGGANTADAVQWRSVAEALRDGDRAVEEYRGIALLAREAEVPDELARLQQLVPALRSRLKADALAAFVRYDHAAPQEFFDLYPVEIDAAERSEIARRGIRSWVAVLMKGPEAQSQRLLKAYGSAVAGDGPRAGLTLAYAEALARSRGWSHPRSIGQTMQLISDVRSVSLDPKVITRNVHVFVVRRSSPAAIDIAWTADDLGVSAVDVAESDLDELVGALRTAEPGQTVVIVDPSRLNAYQVMKAAATRSSRAIVGSREEPNPEWEEARNAVEEARRDLRRAEELDRQNQQQAQALARQSRGSGFGMYGAIMGSTFSTMAATSARERLSDAENTFARTSRTVTKEVSESYFVPTATIELVKAHEVAIYLVDVATGRFGSARFKDEARREVTIDLAVAEQDPDRANSTSRAAQAVRSLSAFAEAGVPLTPGAVWRRAADASFVFDKPVASLAATIRGDALQWQVSAAAEQARAKEQSDRLSNRLASLPR